MQNRFTSYCENIGTLSSQMVASASLLIRHLGSGPDLATYQFSLGDGISWDTRPLPYSPDLAGAGVFLFPLPDGSGIVLFGTDDTGAGYVGITRDGFTWENFSHPTPIRPAFATDGAIYGFPAGAYKQIITIWFDLDDFSFHESVPAPNFPYQFRRFGSVDGEPYFYLYDYEAGFQDRLVKLLPNGTFQTIANIPPVQVAALMPAQDQENIVPMSLGDGGTLAMACKTHVIYYDRDTGTWSDGAAFQPMDFGDVLPYRGELAMVRFPCTDAAGYLAQPAPFNNFEGLGFETTVDGDNWAMPDFLRINRGMNFEYTFVGSFGFNVRSITPGINSRGFYFATRLINAARMLEVDETRISAYDRILVRSMNQSRFLTMR